MFLKNKKICITSIFIYLFIIIFSYSILVSCSKKENIKNSLLTPSEMLTNLEKLPYEKISTNSFFYDQLSEVPWKAELILSDLQIEELIKSLRGMFLAFNQGDTEQYMDFRTPRGPQWKINPYASGSNTAEWKKDMDYKEGEVIPSEQEIWRWFLKKISGGNYYEKFWEGVCLLNLTSQELKNLGVPGSSLNYGVYVYTSTQYRGLEADLESMIAYDHVAWQWIYFRSYQFKEYPGSKEILKQDNKIIYADSFFFIKRKTPYPPRPIVIRYYWNRLYNVWIPTSLALGGLHTDLSFKIESNEIF